MAFSYFWGRHVEPPPRPLDARRVALLTGAAEPPEKIPGRVPIWRVRRGDETLYAAESALLAPGVRGYGGPLDILIVVDAEGNFDQLILLRHHETPSYVSGVKDFLASFAGRSPAAPLVPGEDVDAITRATVSSDAVAAAARLTGRKILNAALGRSVPLNEKKEPVDWPWALGIAAFFGAAIWARRRPAEWLRLGFLAVAAGVLGFWAGRFASVGDIARFALWEFPPFGSRLSIYVLLGGGAAVALFFGNLYCGWLCPFGALTEILYKIPVPKITVPPSFARRLTALRLVALGAVIAAAGATRDLGAAAYEPFDDLFARVAAGWSLVFLAALLVVSVVHYRFFCRYLCAAGAALGAVAACARRSPIPGCEGCGECVAVCPTAAVLSSRGDIDLSLCNECGRCRRACPHYRDGGRR